ncbi:S1C family serine protease [Clostridium thermarum]|uniref:S1C family serine protease n=1 Tax=Clostridium thermarum TaxID=1716543 RepID=UPI001123C855|nr:trypsin-like peptidase domain-containing protein [Clostridium thermarum]
MNRKYTEHREGYIDVEEEDNLRMSNCSGAIKFRNNKRKSKLKAVLKGITFVFIASVSGGVTAAIIVDTKAEPSVVGPTYNSPGSIYLADPYPVSSVIPKNSVNNVAETVTPAVVGISHNADDFSGNTTSKFSGSGVVFDSNGYIVTNYHVIQGAEKIMVKLPFNTATPYEAQVVGVDKTWDIAVIKIDAKGLPAARFGQSSKVRQGDMAIAIGNPLGEEYGGTVTTGVVSATGRKLKVKNDETGQEMIYKVFQTDAPIYPGSSGGPLCNEAGEVIGLVSLNASQSFVNGMGFAISIDEVKKVIQAIQENREIERPSFGIEGGTAENVGEKGVNGVYVTNVLDGSGADAAGIKYMDIILEVNGKKINTKEDFEDLEENFQIGTIVKCKVWRDGTTFEVDVTITKLQ